MGFKRSPFKKKRKVSLSSLKKKLWKIFSEYIRRRDADENGMVKCISCSTWKHWRDMDCGHFIPKSLGLAVYFLETNTAAQCQKCNLTYQGNQYEFALALKERYGDGIISELNEIQRSFRKIPAWEYEEMIEKYQAKVAVLPSTQKVDRDLD